MNYSQIPTVDQFFAQCVPVPLVTQVNGGFRLGRKGSDIDPNNELNTISVILGGNLLVATLNPVRISDTTGFITQEANVKSFGSNSFNFDLSIERKGNETSSVTTEIYGINGERSTTNTKFMHIYDLNDGYPNAASVELITSGFNETGMQAPTFSDPYIFGSTLEYLYGTSKTIGETHYKTQRLSGPINQVEIEALGAFWNSWNDFGKAAIGGAGMLIGGVAAGMASGGVAAISGASKPVELLGIE